MKTILKPESLKWARERVHLTVEQLAKKIGVKEEQVVEWEDSGEITLSQAERLADVTYIPLGYLFLPEPPVENLPIRDFRTLNGDIISKPSPELLDTISEALRRQDWYRSYLLTNEYPRPDFIGTISPTVGAKVAAEDIRAVIKWDAIIRSKSSNWEDVLSHQIDAVENVGILVMQNSVVGQNN